MHLSARHVTLPMFRHPFLGTFGSNNSDDWAPFVAPVSRQSFKSPLPGGNKGGAPRGAKNAPGLISERERMMSSHGEPRLIKQNNINGWKAVTAFSL
jgi:hypothetical protein